MIIFQLKIFVFFRVDMSFLQALEQHKCLNENYLFTQEKLPAIRTEIAESLETSHYKDKLCIVVTGSYGRHEASEESDIDLYWFIDADIADKEETLKTEIESVGSIINRHVTKDTGSTGTFGTSVVVTQSDLVGNIGGDKDTNMNLTRRMLLLLEGTSLYNKDKFNEIRRNLINKYIKIEQNPNQIPRFLLNDIIRYYRTITTDFEFKVSEGSKEWGLRNVKLKFSRKFLYFGGLLSIADLIGVNDIEQQKEKLEQIFDKPVFEKVYACAEKHNLIEEMHQIFNLYDNFIEKISNPENRKILESVTKSQRNDNALYQELRKDSEEFSLRMEEFIKNAFGNNFISYLIF